jgi:DNA-binding transcriptional MerR regulator
MKVETSELLSIGRFARLSGLTVKALRHYEAEGLIRPAHVDEWTGYRYYSPGQARDAITIRRLRELELPLDEIAGVLHADPDTVRERLAVHRARLHGRAVEVQQLVRELDLLIEGKEPLVQETIVEPRIDELPALRMAVIADRVAVDDMFTFVPGTIERLMGWLAEYGLECRTSATFLLDPVEGIEHDSLDVEVGVDVPEGVEGDELVRVKAYPAVRAAVHEHRGRTRACRRCTSRSGNGSLRTDFGPPSRPASSTPRIRATRPIRVTTSRLSAGR